jgi:iron complex transport system substrate-binding protein
VRIASLSPAATEIVVALGLDDHLVGVTRRCDWPPEVLGTPVVTRSGSPSLEIDEEALAGVRPDLVVIVAAGGTDPADHRRLVESARSAAPDATILALDPTSIEGILNAISTVGAMTSAEDAALDLVESLRARLGEIEDQVQARRDGGQPPARVVALGWLDPLAAVGRWIPEQVRRAGGWELLGRAGEPAIGTSWEAVHDVDPDVLVLMPAGLSLAAARRAWDAAPKPSFWRSIEAVRRGQVFAVDGEAHFSRPGPRVIEGIAILAEIFDPDGLVDVSPVGSWTPLA